MLKNYFILSLRNLVRNRIYSLINIAGLTIGLAAAMLILLYTKDEVSYDRFHAHQDRLYRIVSDNVTPNGDVEGKSTITGYLQGPKFQSTIPEVLSFVRYHSTQLDVKQGTEVKSQEIYLTDSSFFKVFSFPLLKGNPKTALQHPKSLVLTEEMALKQFGTTDALGKVMLIKDKETFEPYTVTGIAQKSPQNSSIKFDILMPIVVTEEEIQNKENWFNMFLNTFVLVAPGTNISTLEAKMNRIYLGDAKDAIQSMHEKYNVKNTTYYRLQPFTDMHLSKELPVVNGLQDGSNPMFSYILSGIALFILLIACINFVNLTLARSLKRAKEIGVRKVVGSGRKQLIMQFMGESFVLCSIAFGLAIGLVEIILPTFNQLADKKLALSYLVDVKLIATYILLFLLTGALAGFYPALVLSSYNPVQTLYNRFQISGKNYLQKSLVVLQFSLASFLIIATLTIFDQFSYLTHKDLGYDDHNLITIPKSNLTRTEGKLLKEQLLLNPAIEDVALKNRGSWGTSARINKDQDIQFSYETVDATYLPLLHIPIIKGRNFSGELPTDSTKSVLVNESFVKEAGWRNPIGQEVNFWYNDNERYTVVGVVKDHHFSALNEKIRPQLFTMKPKNQYGMAFIKIRPHTETVSLQHIEKVFKKLFPINPYIYTFREQENLKNYESEAKWKQIMLFGAILTIFISCIGLFGLATLSAEKRTKEIGIRKVLGASVSSIVQLLSIDFIKLVGISFVFAFPVAWFAANKWLENYPYRTDIGWSIFLLTAALAMTIALLTVSYQAIKSALANPVKSLRTE
ncbi:ABC transporter permease [Cytophagaceae bacterium YF14B1]|uniref:ABC transporter permease n=1 Tax=Xanthocytophaga flava TaxID=3048013 RepID=A0AAE3QT48_9BACT|nr:ABC transporter permease [Xanthocytophaga flavus]MDJ1482990.1 ABC transporter permease [Xanthocytophaga flavus]